MVKILDLRKEFLSLRGRVVALDGVSLEVDPGAFYVLLGPSGCGKTTLLNIVAGIEKPSDGEVWIGDRLVVSAGRRTFVSPRDRNVAMVFQSYALYPHMSVFDNIAFPLSIAKVDKSEIGKRVKSVAEALEISQLLRVKPAELSGGQRQRVAIGRAIVKRPALLLLDEPLSNLDAQLRVAMRRELKEIQRRMNLTTLYVTHDQVEAMTLGDRIAVMRDGHIEQAGSPDDVYNNPKTTFAARFVGTPPMNLLEGRILAAAGADVRLPEPLSTDEILFGIRPERLRVLEKGSPAVLSGVVTMVGSLGIEKLLYMRVEDQEVLAKFPGGGSFAEGEEVALAFKQTDLIFFNKRDGRRVDVRGS
jgi:multiple sugar transport system ATP-binding protein